MKIELTSVILPADQPQRLVVRASDFEPNIIGLHLTFIRIGELRDDWVRSCNVKFENINCPECKIDLNFEPGLYQIAEALPDTGEIREAYIMVPRNKRDDLYFYVGDGSSPEVDPVALAASTYAARSQFHSLPIYTENALKTSGSPHKAIIFFVGVELRHPQQLKGCSIRPVAPRMGLASLNEVVATHLYQTMGQPIGFAQSADADYRARSPLFAVHIENLFATDMDDALRFALQRSVQISTLIAVERGERPTRCAVFIADGAQYCLYPVSDHYRGNIVSTLFENDHAERIEQYLPILAASRRARLDLEIYAQALAERDRGFQYFRFWALLETIAGRHITSDTTHLIDPDGTAILNANGQPQTSQGNAGKVYQYLFENGVPFHSLGWKGAEGKDVIMPGTAVLEEHNDAEIVSLWTAVRATYAIRNAVAHDGYFEPDLNYSKREEIVAARMYSNGRAGFGFLSNVTLAALFRELDTVVA